MVRAMNPSERRAHRYDSAMFGLMSERFAQVGQYHFAGVYIRASLAMLARCRKPRRYHAPIAWVDRWLGEPLGDVVEDYDNILYDVADAMSLYR